MISNSNTNPIGVNVADVGRPTSQADNVTSSLTSTVNNVDKSFLDVEAILKRNGLTFVTNTEIAELRKKREDGKITQILTSPAFVVGAIGAIAFLTYHLIIDHHKIWEMNKMLDKLYDIEISNN